MPITLYHNNRCSKSREALQFLQERGAEVNVVPYLEQPLDEMQLRELASQLGIRSPREMMRVKEELYRELDLAAADDAQLFAALAQYPKLLERPIAVYKGRAAIGRPLQNIADIL